MTKNENSTNVEKNSGKFQKGHKKTGGRKKGTPNKKTAQFKDKLGSFDTVAELKTLFDTCEDDDLKFAICKEFLKYEYPQRKAIDFDAENNGDFVLTINRKAVKAETDGNNV